MSRCSPARPPPPAPPPLDPFRRGMLPCSSMGVEACRAPAPAHHATGRSCMNRTPVQQLMDACSRRDIEAALAVLTEDALYHNLPLAPVQGHGAIREVLGTFLHQASEVDWI